MNYAEYKSEKFDGYLKQINEKINERKAV